MPLPAHFGLNFLLVVVDLEGAASAFVHFFEGGPFHDVPEGGAELVYARVVVHAGSIPGRRRGDKEARDARQVTGSTTSTGNRSIPSLSCSNSSRPTTRKFASSPR